MPADVYVGVGSNIDPEDNVVKAIAALRERFDEVECSPIYRNAAIGFDGDDFLNMVVSFSAALNPKEVERSLREIEAAAGRERRVEPDSESGVPARGESLGPRTLDLDLLLYGSMVDASLRVPRRDVLRYAFVLRPLAELAPELIHPVTGRTVGDEWEERAGDSPPMQEETLSF